MASWSYIEVCESPCLSGWSDMPSPITSPSSKPEFLKFQIAFCLSLLHWPIGVSDTIYAAAIGNGYVPISL